MNEPQKAVFALTPDEPNELDSTGGVPDDELTRRFCDGIRLENEMRWKEGFPVAKYDRQKNAAYLEYPDGRREYVEKS